MFELRVPYHSDIRIHHKDIQSVRSAIGNLHWIHESTQYRDDSYELLYIEHLHDRLVVASI